MYQTCNKKPTQYPTKVHVFSLHIIELLNYRLPQYGNSCLLTPLGGVHLQYKVLSALRVFDKWYSTKSNSTTVKDIISRGVLIETDISINKKSWFPPKNSLNYMGADKSLARPGRKQANVSVRMTWISFGALLCRKKNLWQLASRCCWNRAVWHASELVSFLMNEMWSKLILTDIFQWILFVFT